MKSTPSLFFDKEIVKSNIEHFLNNLTEKCKLLFSVKSFPFQDGIDWIAPYIEGFDISNEYEAKLISKWNEKIISVVGPYYNIDLIEQEIGKRADYIYNDLENLLKFNSKNNLSLRVKVTDFIQISPHELPSRFGASKSQISNLTNDYSEIGFHFHASSNNLICREMFENFFLFLKEINVDFDKIRNINLGGGWYTTSIDRLRLLINYLQNKTDAVIHIEPGHGIFRDAGYAVCKVISNNLIGNSYFVTTDISPDLHLKWTTLYMMDDRGSLDHSFYLCGPTCFEGDIMKINGDASRIDVGEILVFKGICSYSVGWNVSFNGVQPVKIIFE